MLKDGDDAVRWTSQWDSPTSDTPVGRLSGAELGATSGASECHAARLSAYASNSPTSSSTRSQRRSDQRSWRSSRASTVPRDIGRARCMDPSGSSGRPFATIASATGVDAARSQPAPPSANRSMNQRKCVVVSPWSLRIASRSARAHGVAVRGQCGRVHGAFRRSRSPGGGQLSILCGSNRYYATGSRGIRANICS